jgi:hypothetical protein
MQGKGVARNAFRVQPYDASIGVPRRCFQGARLAQGSATRAPYSATMPLALIGAAHFKLNRMRRRMIGMGPEFGVTGAAAE